MLRNISFMFILETRILSQEAIDWKTISQVEIDVSRPNFIRYPRI